MYKVTKISGTTVEFSKRDGIGGESSQTMPIEKFKKDFGKEPKKGDTVDL